MSRRISQRFGVEGYGFRSGQDRGRCRVFSHLGRFLSCNCIDQKKLAFCSLRGTLAVGNRASCEPFVRKRRLRSQSGAKPDTSNGRKAGSKNNGGPVGPPFSLYPQVSGFGAAKPAHPGIRDSRFNGIARSLPAECPASSLPQGTVGAWLRELRSRARSPCWPAKSIFLKSSPGFLHSLEGRDGGLSSA
jgi:hypothetical protein